MPTPQRSSHFPRRLHVDTFRTMVASGGWLIIGGTACPKPKDGFEEAREAHLVHSEICIQTRNDSYTARIGMLRHVEKWHIEIIDPTIAEEVLFHLVHLPKLAQTLR
jgi:hypothetical protein